MTECVQRMNIGHSPHHSIIWENKITSPRLGKLKDLEEKSPVPQVLLCNQSISFRWPFTLAKDISRLLSVCHENRKLRTGADLREQPNVCMAGRCHGLHTPPGRRLIGLVWIHEAEKTSRKPVPFLTQSSRGYIYKTNWAWWRILLQPWGQLACSSHIFKNRLDPSKLWWGMVPCPR